MRNEDLTYDKNGRVCVSYNVEMAKDLATFYGIDAEAELTAILQQMVNAEVIFMKLDKDKFENFYDELFD